MAHHYVGSTCLSWEFCRRSIRRDCARPWRNSSIVDVGTDVGTRRRRRVHRWRPPWSSRGSSRPAWAGDGSAGERAGWGTGWSLCWEGRRASSDVCEPGSCNISSTTQFYQQTEKYEWSNVWQLQIAVDKCFVCNIHPGSKRSSTDLYKYVLNTLVLKNVDVFRDLGVHVDCLLKFDRHISLIVHKAMTRARLILRCFLSRDRQLLFKAYSVYDVRPLLEYCNCSAVWSLISNFWCIRWKVFNGSLQNACRACGGMQVFFQLVPRRCRLAAAFCQYSRI